MKKIGRLSLYLILGSFIVIQFFGVEKNTSDAVPASDFLMVHESMPGQLSDIIRNSCYDCHSNHTNYPWYSHVAPFSWLIGQHIRNGKRELNFNVYDTLTKRKKIGLLDNLCEVVSDSSMPPSNYLILHSDAILSKEDKTMLCDWAEEEALMLMRKK